MGWLSIYSGDVAALIVAQYVLLHAYIEDWILVTYLICRETNFE